MSSRQISRRTMLRGAGVSVALPMLEVMAPAAARAGDPQAPTRFVCMFVPNGVYPPAWDVKGSGRDYVLSPILEPIAPYRADVTVVSNLSTNAKGHVAAVTSFLTGTPLQVRADAPALVPKMGISLDQHIAKKIGRETRLPSIELGTDPPRAGGENNLPVSFASTVSWSGPSTKVDPEINPRAAFNRLFGDGTDDRARQLENRSLLDRVLESSKRLNKRVSQSDRRKLDEYLTSVREVEKRIEESLSPRPRTSAWQPKTKPELVRPEDGLPERRDVHLRMMTDLVVLAIQTDTTRVATLMTAHGFSRQNFSFLDGVKGDHHSISHHKEQEDLTRPYTIVSRWYVSQLAYLLEKMKSIDEGDGSLLDHSVVLFGCDMKDGNGHTTKNLPIVVAGRAGGKLNPGSHVVLEPNTPLANLHLTILQRMGLEEERFNTSNGVIAL